MARKKIISDIVIAPRREISAQLFQAPEPSVKEPPAKKRMKRFKKSVLISLSTLLIFFLGSFLFARMELNIAVKKNLISAEKNLTLSASPKGEELLFKNFSIPYSKTLRFSATQKISQDAKAEGTVVIFNKGKDPQVLIASTRLETPGGKIYRIPKTIAVPASKTDGGKTIPGSLETLAIADKPGDDYNIGLTDFTLPGLKGSPRFNLVFGRSKTPMEGGSSGEKVTVGKADRDSAREKLLEEIKNESESRARDKLPQSEYLIVPSLEYAAAREILEEKAPGGGNEFELKIEGELRGASISRAGLETILLQNQAQRIKNLESLPVKISGYKFGEPSFKLILTGKAEAEGLVDTEFIKTDILAKTLFEPSTVLASNPGLSRAEARFRPFWIRYAPSYFITSPSSIDIILE